MKPDSITFRYRFEYDPMNIREFLRDRYGSRSQPGWLDEIFPSRISINGETVDDSFEVRPGDWIEYEHRRSDEEDLVFEPKIIYEDDYVLAISKPDFVPVSPSGRYYFNSAAIRLKEAVDSDDISPAHRLDLETSGVLIFGKSRKARRKIQPLFEKKKIEKRYQAVCFGPPPLKFIEGDIVPDTDSQIYTKLKLTPSDTPNSRTEVEKTEPFGGFWRVWLKPTTGKTNQLRVHLAGEGCPIVGDKKYFPNENVYLDWIEYRDIDRILPSVRLGRHALHCEEMSYICPFSGERIEIRDETRFWKRKIEPLKKLSDVSAPAD